MSARTKRRLGMSLGAGFLFTAVLFVTVQAADVPPANDQAASNLLWERHSLEAVCAKCHKLQIVMNTPMSHDAWRQTVQKMLDRGANATDDQLDAIMDYLDRTMTVIDVNTADSDELQIVLDVTQDVARAIVARRAMRKFSSLTDLESIPGVTRPAVESRTRLIRF